MHKSAACLWQEHHRQVISTSLTVLIHEESRMMQPAQNLLGTMLHIASTGQLYH